MCVSAVVGSGGRREERPGKWRWQGRARQGVISPLETLLCCDVDAVAKRLSRHHVDKTKKRKKEREKGGVLACSVFVFTLP